ncbi:MAG: hypothetical protein E5V66_29525 [Mesorhizobium sp.]|uniref:hypothetical protein n=1 Tax=Mesorhizobium sp. TaxID=1871066 RepID=UPI00122B5DF9|nr:hypothetical protein [Mesorhizobium sp.]TIW07818.1 MAG: hypothetical protein E5V66_29525 [Mesorhizobium sp.]
MRRAFSLTSAADPDELAEELEALAARTGYPHFVKLAKAARRPGPGQRSPTTERAIADRDVGIREIATFCTGSRWAKCQQVSKLLRHYETTTWRLHDFRLEDMPKAYSGTPFAGAFAALKSGQPMPGLRHLQRILKS